MNLDAWVFEQSVDSPLWLPASAEPAASTFCTSDGTTMNPPTLKELQRIAESFPRPEHDRIVTTYRIWESVKQQLQPEMCEVGLLAGREFAGLPVELYATEAQAAYRAWTLREDGKRPMLVIEDAFKTKEKAMPANRETVTVFYSEQGRDYGFELVLQHYPPVPNRHPSSWPAPDDVPVDPDVLDAKLIEIDERGPTPEEMREYGLAWVTDASRLDKILEEVR